MKKRPVRYSLLVLAVIWMALIFGFSAQSATESGGLSALITEPLTNLIIRLSGEMSAEAEMALYMRVDGIVRSAAHFCEYTVLGMLLTAVLRAFGVKIGWVPWVIGAAYAVTDEWHQAYSPGRSSDPMDVLIDAAGVLCGVLIYHFIRKIWRRLYVHHQ